MQTGAEGASRAREDVDRTMAEPAGAGPTPTGQKLITRTFVLAWLVNLSQYLTFYFLVTTMALYAVRAFAASDAAGGLASSAFVIGATVARLFTGYVVDRLGRRRVMMAALVLAAVSCALYFAAGSLALLVAVRVLHGFTYAFASTAIMALAQAAIPPTRRGEGTGYLALGTTLATAVGPALGLFVTGTLDYAVLFAVALGSTVVGLVLAVFLQDPATTAAGEGTTPVPAARPRFSLAVVVHPAVVPIGIFMVVIGLCYGGVMTFLNALAEERDLAAGAGLFFVAYAAAMLLMRLTLGTLQDRRGDNPVVAFGLMFFALALVLLAVSTEDWHVVVAGALTGLGYGTLMPAAQAIAVSRVQPHQYGAGISTLLLFADVGLGLGPVALGGLASAAGFGAMYLVLAGFVLVAAAWYAAAHGRFDHARR
ncbi:MFS transporter [Citricoccus sp. CH26A]|uniref:MFS transporter n=1 Tax=Citricoccus TaxID=169133 RepID=UPI00192AF4DD|nr:MFS transporter [Citricoccus sp. CH26A]